MGYWEVFQLIKISYGITVVMVIGLHTFVKTHQILDELCYMYISVKLIF